MATFKLESFVGNATSQRSQVSPTVDFGIVSAINVVDDGSVYLKHITAAGEAPGNTGWICGVNSYLSFNLFPTRSMTLEIHIIAVTDYPLYDYLYWRALPLLGNAMNWRHPIFVPAWAFRLKVINKSGAAGTVSGMIKVQAL